MRHQAAVELGQQIVRQPVGAVDGLRRLQARVRPWPHAARLRRGNPVAPACGLAAQHAEPVKDAAGMRHAAARPPRAHRAAIAPVAGEELVAALAGEDDLEPGLPRHPGQRIGRQDRVIGRRIVDGPDDLGQGPPEIGFAEDDLDMLGADLRRDPARRLALVGDAVLGKADRKGLDRPLGEPRHHHQHRGRIDAARQEHAERHVGALVDADTFHQRRIEAGERLVFGDRQRPASGKAARRRRSTIRPRRTTTVSPGRTRLMPAKIVSRPVVNCICSSSSRAVCNSAGVTSPASISAPGSEAKAKPSAVSA